MKQYEGWSFLEERNWANRTIIHSSLNCGKLTLSHSATVYLRNREIGGRVAGGCTFQSPSGYWKAGPANLLWCQRYCHSQDSLSESNWAYGCLWWKSSPGQREQFRAEYKYILFAEQEREVLSENMKLEYYVLGEQFLSSLWLMDWTKSAQFVSCDNSLTNWQSFHFWVPFHIQLLVW